MVAERYRPNSTGAQSMSRSICIPGYKLKDGKLIKQQSYGLNTSAKIAKRKNATKPKVVSRRKAGASQ